MNNALSPTLKHLLLFIARLLGVYIILFAMCLYAHVNESNIIVNRTDALLTEVALEGKSDLIKVASVQNMARKIKPIFFEPSTVFNSLFGKRESYILINKLLGNAVESHKADLSGLVLGKVDLEGADLSGADLHGSDIRKANLSGAKLGGANLITAKLNLVNFQGASFLNTKVYKADFSEADLRGAELRYAVGLTCEQIKSAVIDESTRLPDNISLEGSSESAFKCINIRGGKGMNLSGINLAKAYLRYSDLSESDLSHSNFQGADLYDTRLQNANLSKANLQGAEMSHSSFQGANLTGTDLRGAGLGRAAGLTCEQIKSAVIDENTVLPDYISLKGSSESAFKCINLRQGKGLDLSRTDRPKAYLRYSDLSESDLSHSNFQGADFYDTRFQGADLSHANLKGTNLEYSSFQDSNLVEADLRGASLGRALGLTCEQIKSAVIDGNTVLPDYISLEGSSESAFKCMNLHGRGRLDLSGINLAKAYLRYSDLSESDLSHSNFEGADLYQSGFQNANLGHANLKDAKMSRSSFQGANLAGADLRGAELEYVVGLTCAQIKSAVIDENTLLPDYISLECGNTLNEN